MERQTRIFDPSVSLRCLGSGDAFGSGGRLNSCYHLKSSSVQMLLDCGCSSLIGMQRWGVIAAEIDMVVVTHLHGDHFGGIPFLLLEGKYASQRSKPLTLIGPPGLQQRVEATNEAFYPGTLLSEKINFPVEYQLLDPRQPRRVNGVQIECFQVKHGHSQQAYGLRITIAGKIVSYTGDTEWTENLIPLSQGSDLFIAECFSYRQKIPSHLDYQTVLKNRSRLGGKKFVLTHMGPEMLSRSDNLDLDIINDGDVIEV
ncbi:Ribonuclease BN, tRNA processing enzyme [Desulfuromusa kysingii]|uniref:Ribonuclease BN, tRNA processing enzyme n=1 Tax=Desulfuromusa kysingii TaxID=37625 RepID=A0A1H4AVA2_9BACT|nr:MBL fold metallo-hydrolase [Desulfuromusa kysingii]SEA39756.1 Ribonuclease BN, tRNA processing enzyme [Desulfuromusa kysingii]